MFLRKIEARTIQPIQDKDRGESPDVETNREGCCGDATMYNIIYKCGEPEKGELVKTEVLRVKCLRENAMLPKRGSREFGSTGMQSQGQFELDEKGKTKKKETQFSELRTQQRQVPGSMESKWPVLCRGQSIRARRPEKL